MEGADRQDRPELGEQPVLLGQQVPQAQRELEPLVLQGRSDRRGRVWARQVRRAQLDLPELWVLPARLEQELQEQSARPALLAPRGRRERDQQVPWDQRDLPGVWGLQVLLDLPEPLGLREPSVQQVL